MLVETKMLVETETQPRGCVLASVGQRGTVCGVDQRMDEWVAGVEGSTLLLLV